MKIERKNTWQEITFGYVFIIIALLIVYFSFKGITEVNQLQHDLDDRQRIIEDLSYKVNSAVALCANNTKGIIAYDNIYARTTKKD